MDNNPLLEYLGIRLVDWKPGRAEFALDIEARHLNRQGGLHGGVIATMLDAACGHASPTPEEEGKPGNAVTVMLAISYVAKVNTGRVTVVGKVTTAGHKLYFASAELVSDTGQLVATAQGTFKANKAK